VDRNDDQTFPVFLTKHRQTQVDLPIGEYKPKNAHGPRKNVPKKAVQSVQKVNLLFFKINKINQFWKKRFCVQIENLKELNINRLCY
jgi:hypothetical protein